MPRPSFFAHLHQPTIPQRSAAFTYTWGLGTISLLLIVVLVFTGALEMFLYQPTAAEAHASVSEITFRAPYGWFVRNLHYWAGQWLVITSILHMGRVVLTGGYKHGRRFNWLIGMTLLVLVIALNFTGLVLRWDQSVGWALLVGTNLTHEIPLVGNTFYRLLVGGDAINATTPTRFYAWHIVGLMVPLFILLVWHGWRVRRDGGISYAERRPRIHRDVLIRQETLTAIVTLLALGITCLLWDAPLDAPADFHRLVTSSKAPWFFLGIQELLRFASPFVAGVLIPGVVVLVVAMLPYLLDRREDGGGRWFSREGRWAHIFLIATLVAIIGLSLRGWLR